MTTSLHVGVVGGTGRTGQAVAAALARAGHAPTVLTRSPDGTTRHPQRRLDLEHPTEARAALAGLDALYVVPPRLHPAEDDLAARAFDAAREAGVRRVVYHSVMHPSTPGVPHHLRKATAETRLRESDLAWAIVQPNTYAQNVLGRLRNRGPGQVDVLSLWPQDAPPLAFVDLLDVAEAAVEVLRDDRYLYGTYELAGPELLRPPDVADRVAEAWQVRAEARTVSAEELPAAEGGLRHLADHYAYHAHYAEHGFPGSPHILETLLGRPATPLVEVLRGHRTVLGEARPL